MATGKPKKELQPRVKEALDICQALGLPVESLTARRRERMALVLLAVAKLGPNDGWEKAKVWNGEGSHALTTREIITFRNESYDEGISSGSYDDVRRKDLAHLVEAGIVVRSVANPSASTNNPTRRYAVAGKMLNIFRSFGTDGWPNAVSEFIEKYGRLSDRLDRPRQIKKIPIKLPSGVVLSLDPGAHNQIQKAVIDEFLPRFVPDAGVLYLGDASNKYLHRDAEALVKLGLPEFEHDMLPDIVAYSPSRNWLFLIEAVYSSNPVDKLRHLRLEAMTKECSAGLVFVTAFQDRTGFRKWVADISWETEVWLADEPDHMIHFNGDRFFGPHQNDGKA